MNRSTFIRSGAGLTLALLMTTAVHAMPQDGPEGPRDESRKGRMEERFKRMEKELGLSSDQAKKLEEHRKAHREESRQLFDQMKQKRQALEAEMEKPSLNMSQIKILHNELKDIQNKLADQRLDGILEVRKILTPEQFKKFHEMKKKDDPRDSKHRRGQKGGRGLKHDEDGADDMNPPPPMKK